MKTLIKILIALLITISLLSCCKKEYIDPCEIKQTFSLRFNNCRIYRGCDTVKLSINSNLYTVMPDEVFIINVPIIDADKIYLLNECNDTLRNLSKVIGRPNACETYSYYWFGGL